LVSFSDYILTQNYPNPFNPSITILYSLPKASVVTLTIYNTLGQEINTLVNGQDQKVGSYEATWNGKDNFGNSVSPGIYFYQLKTNELILSKKMMLMK